MLKITHCLKALMFIFLLQACATYQTVSKENTLQMTTSVNDEVDHVFYLIGDAGNAAPGSSTPALMALKNQIASASKNSTVLFLGDNIYEAGLPGKNDPGREIAEHRLNVQLDAVKDFKGGAFFIPGNHDWYTDGLKGLKRQEEYIEDRLGKNTFQPENGCPIEKVEINKQVTLLILDSQWYLEDWDKHPTMNDECDYIKTREQFFAEVESEMNKAEGKTLVIAMHHPLASNGAHGGHFSADKHLFPFQRKFPLPVIGSAVNYIRKTGGVSSQDLQSIHYRELSKRLLTLAQDHNNIVFVSGHEHNQQYLINQNVPIIISGAGSKTSAAGLYDDGVFSSGQEGFAKLTIYKNGRSEVSFYTMDNAFAGPVFATQVLEKDEPMVEMNFKENFSAKTSATVYTESETRKGKLYASLWGAHYRDEYSTPVSAPTAMLDTLYGGLIPTRKGGGHQSKSLRLKSKDGKEYMMRAVRKSALRFLQSVAFKDRYIKDDYADTYSEKLLLDFYTAAHPYAALSVGDMADAIKVLHANPALFYVPKQSTLGEYNDTFGDELYIIEERVDSGQGEVASFDFSDKIISTDDLFRKLREKDKNKVDKRLYIRSRLFDMLLGDWDRHEDQWRWAEKDMSDGKKMYKPIPRDRDQVFSDFDGPLLGLFTRLVPSLRLMQTYDADIRNLKWFNDEPYPLDLVILDEHNISDWLEEAAFIQDHLTNDVVDRAFSRFPEEMKNAKLAEVRSSFEARKNKLKEIAEAYYHHLKKTVILTGTDKDDWFEITRMPDGITKIEAYRILKGEKKDKFLDTQLSALETKEIWIYGLDDDDVFEVKGAGNKNIKLRLIGGQNNDVYKITSRENVHVYDYRSKENTFETSVARTLSDSYDLNTYNYKKTRKTVNQLLPLIGFNPDDGLKLGVNYTLTYNSLNRNPFTQKHHLAAAYYFATTGFDIRYEGEIANIFEKWNFGLDAVFTSPNFAINYFGFGNDSENDDDDFDLDYNRVRYSTISISPKLVYRGYRGSYFKIGPLFQVIEVEDSENRFINIAPINAYVFDAQNFLGAEFNYGYKNFNDIANPTLGMGFDLVSGYKANLDNNKDFFYVIPQLRFTSNVDAAGAVVFATKFKGHFNIANGFEFYQGATIGGIDGLRGYRNQRFTGRTAYYQNSDIRLNLANLRTGIIPMKWGVYGGFDYGRVWIDDDPSRRWHSSAGGGMYFNASGLFTANFSLFNSDDGNRFAFAMAFNF